MSGRPGFHRPGLAVGGLARDWSPSLPLTRIVPVLLLPIHVVVGDGKVTTDNRINPAERGRLAAAVEPASLDPPIDGREPEQV